jgi:integrase
VTGGSGQAGLDALEAARGRCDPRALDQLWAAVPEQMRLSRFAPDTVPPQYAGAFCHDGTWRAGLDLSGLPEPMSRELAWCVFRIIELGGTIPSPGLSILVRRLGEVIADRPGQPPVSLLEMSGRGWCQQIQHAVHRRTGRLPAPATMRTIRALLTRMMRLLVIAMDTGPWWQLDHWNPVEDTRIPLREHEPMGRFTVRFDRIGAPWLRRGLQWHCKVGLDTGTLRWSTVHRRVVAVSELGAFLRDRGVDEPRLAATPGQVRALMLDFLGQLRTRQAARGRRAGQRLSAASVQRLAADVEQFYLFMADNKEAAAAALGEPGWLRLGPEHAGFYRRGELPGKQRRDLGREVIDDAAMSQIMAGLGLLGAPASQGGFGDEQAMRITMLVALLGRRISEICLLDRDPLLPLLPVVSRPAPSAGTDSQAPAARLRYQQTKIDGAPDTVLVHAEIVAIIREQQDWADRFFSGRGTPGKTPKYLFLAAQMNRNGDRPYSSGRLRDLLSLLARRLDVRDATGALVDFHRTHRFRHTVATSLLNTGVPIHVVQRYLGHVSPAMTMHYAQTLQSTAEAEFLRYRKLTADARELGTDPTDLYDLLQLDQRTDRMLPNGYCLLPPRQVCGKGNACLTCDKFATDATFLPELTSQLNRTGQLVETRQAAFLARTGTPMGEDNVWLAGRRTEQNALRAISTELESNPHAAGPQAVRGAGTTARTDAITSENRRLDDPGPAR